MDSAKSTPPNESLLRDSLDGFLHLVTVVFLDSIVFFITLGLLCILFPRTFIRIINPLAQQRWKPTPRAQNDFRMLAAIFLLVVHVVLCLLFGTQDDLGITPNAPTVFWAVVWSTGIVSGVFGGFLAATVLVLVAMDVVGV
jgi:hypothetical protein